jgi:MYXO-CTERM domain-containing protein
VTGQATLIDVVGLGAGLQAQVAWQGQSLGVTLTSAVPEPAGWALWLAGLAGAAGLRGRRRAG